MGGDRTEIGGAGSMWRVAAAWRVRLRRAAAGLALDTLDAITDRRCPGCDGDVGRAEWICPACDAQVPRRGSVHCLCCLRGDPPAPAARATSGCPAHGSGRFLLAGPLHEPPLAAIVRAFKYGGVSRLAPWIASLVPEPPGIRGDLGRETVVVPVPLHPARRAARGFDQAALLAACVGEWWGVPVIHALRRVRETDPQARQDGEARRRNVRGAFAAAPGMALLLHGRAVLLLDDVATTGSTLLEAADALEAACAPGGIVSLVAARGGLVEGPQSPSHATVAAFGTPVLESQAWQIGEKPPGSAV